MELFSLRPYANLKICAAVSGGSDSVALLHYLRAHAAEYSITLTALTCEHGIRGEASEADLSFVEKLCGEWGIPLAVYREDVPALARTLKTGVEEAGRIFRYRCFEETVASGKADVVATAHHKDDFAETVLFRLIRGTSLGGLDVFPDRKGIIRPMIGVAREAIRAYILQNGLSYVEDESNSDERYTRNYLRHTALPALEQAVKGAGEHLVSFALRAREDDRLLCELAEREIVREPDGGRSLSAKLPDPLFMRACLSVLKSFGVNKDYTEANLREVAALKTLQSGKRACLPSGLTAIREYEKIVIYPSLSAPFSGEIPFGVGSVSFGPYILSVTAGEGEGLRADFDAFPQGCVWRTRREGDVFTPYGGGTKTLKKFLTDRKIPSVRGRTLPLVAKGKEIYAVCGVEISDRVRITEKTARAVRIAARENKL